MQAFEKPVNELRPLHEIAHEQKQRDRDQYVVRHHPVGALHEKIEHLLGGEIRIDAAVSEPGEEHAHAHQREGRGEPDHDGHHNQREHQQPEDSEVLLAQVCVEQVAPRGEHQHHEDDHRHQREAEPEFLADLHLPGS